jgi:SAM-dependent methyltransferase
MNINTHNWKVNSVVLKGKQFAFNLNGYSRSRHSEGILAVNGHELRCSLDEATDASVPFAPKRQGLFLWSASCSVPSTAIRDGQNLLQLSIDSNQYPIHAWCRTSPAGLVVPPDENIKRVSGHLANQNTYRNGGTTEYLRYVELISQYATGPNRRKLLDWGVGCARVAQHFLLDGQFEVVGVDIDRINIDWCAANVPDLIAYVVPLNPPTTLRDKEFDIIISSSVLSHLIPEHWTSWLAEMYRVLSDDGVAFISFHGDNSCSTMLGNNEAAMKELAGNGYVNLNASADLGVDLEDYYRNTFYTDAYARKLFEKHFTVKALIPGLLSGSQTVAVLIKR